MIVDSTAKDIVYSNLFTGVHGNYLRGSIVAAGLDPDDLPESDPSAMNFGSGGNTDAKAWRDIWAPARASARSSPSSPPASSSNDSATNTSRRGRPSNDAESP